MNEVVVIIENLVGVKFRAFVLLVASCYVAVLGDQSAIQSASMMAPAVGFATQTVFLIWASRIDGKGMVSRLINAGPVGVAVFAVVALAVNFSFWQTLTLTGVIPPNLMVNWE